MTRFINRNDGSMLRSIGHFLLGFLSGLFLGSALGVLLAPHRGDITRRKIQRKVADARDQADEMVEDLKQRKGV